MTPRLIALDVDGTILRNSRRLTRRTRAAIARAQDSGVHVALVTGRHRQEVDFLARSLRLKAPVACCNGSYVYHPGNGAVLRQSALSHRAAVEGTREMQRQGLFFYHYLPEGMLVEERHAARLRFGMLPYVWSSPRGLAAFTRWLWEMRQIRLRVVPDAARYLEETQSPVLMMNVSGLEPANIAAVRESLLQAAGEQAASFPAFGRHLDLIARGQSKASGLASVAAYLGVDPRDAVAIGDNFNDLPMIESAGCGVAMGNAPPEVQTRARRVIAANEADGVAQFIESLLGGDGRQAG